MCIRDSLNTVTDKWILEVRRERGIELCLEMGLRWDDDMRWHMGDLLTSCLLYTSNKLAVANTTTFNFEFVPDVFKVSADATSGSPCRSRRPRP